MLLLLCDIYLIWGWNHSEIYDLHNEMGKNSEAELGVFLKWHLILQQLANQSWQIKISGVQVTLSGHIQATATQENTYLGRQSYGEKLHQTELQRVG